MLLKCNQNVVPGCSFLKQKVLTGKMLTGSDTYLTEKPLIAQDINLQEHSCLFFRVLVVHGFSNQHGIVH